MVHQAKYNRYELERIAEEQADEIGRLREVNAELLAALMEIAKGKGAFSMYSMTFANNTIENMKEIAEAAIANAKEE